MKEYFTLIGDFAFRSSEIDHISIEAMTESNIDVDTHFVKVHLKEKAYCVFTGSYDDCRLFIVDLFK